MSEGIDRAQREPFRAGDAVRHRPTGETWLLACDEERGEVVASGWPETIARAVDCERVRVATDEQRLERLREVARSGGGYRAALAARQLDEATSGR